MPCFLCFIALESQKTTQKQQYINQVSLLILKESQKEYPKKLHIFHYISLPWCTTWYLPGQPSSLLTEGPPLRKTRSRQLDQFVSGRFQAAVYWGSNIIPHDKAKKAFQTEVVSNVLLQDIPVVCFFYSKMCVKLVDENLRVR